MDGYLTSNQLADLLGIKRGSIYRYQTRGDIPKPDEKVGRTPLWKQASVDEWLKTRPGQGWRKGKRDNPDGLVRTAHKHP